jgi:ketosteroid isomerase-like protein
VNVITTDTNGDDEATIAASQVNWIMTWNKEPEEHLGSFEELFGGYYDLDADVVLFDDFDPQRRVFRTARSYGEAFWPTFQTLRSAEHAIAEDPEVLVSGDLASTRMVFIAILDSGNAPAVANRCINSQVWQFAEGAGWRIVRDHTSVEGIDLAEARRAFR